MQTTQFDRYRAAWERRDNETRVLFVQEGAATIHRWPDGVPVEQARIEHPDLGELWTQVREAGHRQHLAESPGAREHADFFHQPY